MRADRFASFSSSSWGSMTVVKVPLSGDSAAATLSRRARVESQRALASVTMESLVPVNSGGGWGGARYLSGAMTSVYSGRWLFRKVVVAGRWRSCWKMEARRERALGEARVAVMAAKRRRERRTGSLSFKTARLAAQAGNWAGAG